MCHTERRLFVQVTPNNLGIPLSVSEKPHRVVRVKTIAMLDGLRRFYDNLPLANKGFIVVGLPIVTFVVTGLITILIINQLRETERLVSEAYGVQLELQKAESLVLDASASVRGYLLTGQAEQKEQFNSASKALPDVLDDVQLHLQDEEQITLFDPVRQQIEAELSALTVLLENAEATNDSASVSSFILTSQVVIDTLKQQIDSIKTQQQTIILSREQAKEAALRLYYPVIMISLLIGVFGGLMGMRLFAAGITRRIRMLSLSAERLARGRDTLIREPSKDEIGRLGSVLSVTGQLLNLRDDELKLANNALRHKFEELTDRHHQIVLLNQLGAALQQSGSLEDIYRSSREKLRALCPMASASLYLYDPVLEEYTRTTHWGDDAPDLAVFYPSQCFASEHERYYVNDGQSALYCHHAKSAYPEMSLCIVLAAQGKRIGQLHMVSKVGLSEDIRQILGAMADRMALALVNFQLKTSLLEQAIRDPLTHLYNRRYLEETLERELQRAKRAGQSVSLLMADLDHFKAINDRYTHDGGDEVLRALGGLLLSSFRGQDISCRYGGEEVIVVMPDTSLEDASRRAEQLTQQVRALRVQVEDETLDSLSVSVGVASYPEHGSTSQELIHSADVAMYRAKRAGRNQVMRFES